MSRTSDWGGRGGAGYLHVPECVILAWWVRRCLCRQQPPEPAPETRRAGRPIWMWAGRGPSPVARPDGRGWSAYVLQGAKASRADWYTLLWTSNSPSIEW